MKNLRVFFTLLVSLTITMAVAQPAGNVGIGTNTPNARLQINHKSTPGYPAILIMDSLDGMGSSIQFGKQNMEGRFAITGNPSGPENSRGLKLSWWGDTLLWLKQNGRVGLGTGNPMARMQINHRSNANSPSLFLLDSLDGMGSSIQFGKQNMEGRFAITGNPSGPENSRGLILSWWGDTLLWLKQNGRMGLGTGSPLARMQINHRSTTNSPSLYLLDSIDGKGASIQFARQNTNQRFAITGGLSGPESSRGIILSWWEDSLLWLKSNGRLGLGTGNPMARMQISHKTDANTPMLLLLDSVDGTGSSIHFGKQNMEGRFAITGNPSGPENSRGMILSWWGDTLLWLKQNGRLGLGTGMPSGRMQVNHRSGELAPHIVLMDSIGGLGGSLAFRKQGLNRELRITGIPGLTRADMTFKIDSLLEFSNNRLGIFTENPLYEIDLNGDVNLAKSLLLNGNSGEAGQVLQSNGLGLPPTWVNSSLPDTMYFKAYSNPVAVAGNSITTISSTTEKYDPPNMHNPANGITTISKEGTYMFTVRCSYTTNSTETGPFLLKIILEILDGGNNILETAEQTTALPAGMPNHTSHVNLNTQLNLQQGQKLRLKVSNTVPFGSVNTKVEEFSGVLL